MTDFTKKSDEVLQKELKEKSSSLQQFRFDSAGSKTRNVREGRNLKKEIAQILTELNTRRS